jgi:hypothetical protein
MSKFLKILEQHDPDNEGNVNSALIAKMKLDEYEIPCKIEGQEIIVHTDKGDVILKAIGFKKKEQFDAEQDDIDVDPNEIAQGIAQRYEKKPLYKRAVNTVFNTGEKQVAKAVKDQAKTYPEIAKYIQRQNDETKKQLAKAKTKVNIK